MFDKAMVRGLVAVAFVASAASVQADVFNMGGTISGGTWTGLASLQFVTVGNPGNVADPASGNLYGSVPYTYQIGTYDVTTAQYVAFLNSVATQSDPYGLYYSGMATDIPTVHIAQSGSPGSYTYAVTGSDNQRANCPVFDVSWGDAARFCNWLQNGQPTAPEGNGTTETGAYTLNGDTSNLTTETRNAGAKYFIPTENEWYKAAYLSPSSGTYWTYPTQSNTAPSCSLLSANTSSNDANWNYNGWGYTDPTNLLTPVGIFEETASPCGAFDMAGDVFQWNETPISYARLGTYRGVRGGSFMGIDAYLMASDYRNAAPPTIGQSSIGFRVASSVAVPEPGSLALLLAGSLCLATLAWRTRKRAA